MQDSPIPPDDLPLQRLYRWERERPDAIHLTQPHGGAVRDWTWRQALDEARRVATWLSSFGWAPGMRIGLYSKNCAWWLIADYAIWMAGHVSVPIFPTLTPGSVRKILEHCDARACIVGRVDQWDTARAGVPTGLAKLAFPGSPAAGESTRWEDVLERCAPLQGYPVRAASDLATLIYTSGTTGMPKGVMHNFFTFGAVPRAMSEHPRIGLREGDRYFCYLSLAHVAERWAIEANGVYIGAHIYFNEELRTFPQDLVRARPHLFFAVPRLWTQFQLGLLSRMPEADLQARVRDPAGGAAFRRQVAEGMGLDAARFLVAGGATMPPALLNWYRELGMEIVEGYGLTETFACCTTNAPGDDEVGTVGRPWPGVDLRVSPEGEIQARAPWIMHGYFEDPVRTAEAFTPDGYLRTGDKGAIDEAGRLRITGRIKEIFKTAKGKYVAPAPIENRIQSGGLIEACCVTGADRPQPLAIAIVSPALLAAIKGDVERKRALEAELGDLVLRTNAVLDPHERLACLVVVAEPWTQDSGHVTGTMKIRRDAIDASYSRHFDEWLARGTIVAWHGFQDAHASITGR